MSSSSTVLNIPVITIDGPTASGKGTIAQRVADALGWHTLDSGALYRLTALAVQQQGVDPGDQGAVADVAKALDVTFKSNAVMLKGNDVSDTIRHENVHSGSFRGSWPTGVTWALLCFQTHH